MTRLGTLENVVRIVFPSTMMREGELLPAAFKLRERDGEAESFVSVFRQYADTFASDIVAFDKARNLPCAIMNVGEIHTSTLHIEQNEVKFDVHAFPTAVYASHAGIVISIGGIQIKGSGKDTFVALGIGDCSDFHLIAIRRVLVDIAKKRMTTVNGIMPQEVI